MAPPLVKLALAALRAAAHAALFLEAQRLALRIARPTSAARLAAREDALLALVRVPVAHVFATSSPAPLHALVAGDPHHSNNRNILEDARGDDGYEGENMDEDLRHDALPRRYDGMMIADYGNNDGSNLIDEAVDAVGDTMHADRTTAAAGAPPPPLPPPLSLHASGRGATAVGAAAVDGGVHSAALHPSSSNRGLHRDHHQGSVTAPARQRPGQPGRDLVVPSHQQFQPPPRQGSHQRPPIVLLHGHSMSAAFFFRNLDDLVAMGYRVYAVDLLGWGRSARPPFAGDTPEDTLDWYLASLGAWADEMGLHSFALLGHSLGAYLAFEFAKRHPGRVTRLIMVSPAAISRNIPLARALYFSLPPQSVVRRGGLLGFLLFMLYYPRSPCYINDRLRDFTYHLAAQTPPSGEVAIIPIIRFDGPVVAVVTRPLIEALDYMPIPVQLVCGETDASIDVKDVHLLYREMKRKGFNVQIAVVPGTDHCPHLESPEAFIDAIAEFVRLK